MNDSNGKSMDARTLWMPPLPVRGPHLKIGLCLGIAVVIATLLVFPYLLTLMPQVFARLPLPLWLVIPIQALQAGVLAAWLAWSNAWRPLGLDSEII